MGTSGTFILDKSASKVARQYLLIEYRKIFSDIIDEIFWVQYEKALNNLIEANESTFWGLVSGLSEAVRLNSVHEHLTNDGLSWVKENIPIEKIILTGMSPKIDYYIKGVCNRDSVKFKEEWKQNEKMRKVLLAQGIEKLHENKSSIQPIITVERHGGYIVVDGMHRTIASIIANRTSIEAWVGRVQKPSGLPLINSGMSMLLLNIWNNSLCRDAELKKSLRRIGKEIISNYKNGKLSLVDRIVGWSFNDEFKSIFKGL